MRRLYLALGCIMVIIGGILLSKFSERWVEVPSVIIGIGFTLLAMAIFQWLFKDRLPETSLFFGTVLISLPSVLVWKASFTPWLIIPFSVAGICFIIKSIRDRSPVG